MVFHTLNSFILLCVSFMYPSSRLLLSCVFVEGVWVGREPACVGCRLEWNFLHFIYFFACTIPCKAQL